MPKRQPLTLEEHRALGTELKAMRDRMNAITVLLSNRCSLRLGDQSRKVGTHLDRLRSELDSLVFKENPAADPDDLLRVYYPGKEG